MIYLNNLKIPGLLILALAFVSPCVMAQSAIDTARTIRVVMDNDYAPYSFQPEGGKLQGILVDQWQEWEKKTGIKVEIHAMDWSEALQRMRAGEFDVIDCIVETVARQDYFDFTPAYNTIEASVYFRNNISGVSDLASLKRFPVGVKTGDQHIDKLKANGVKNMILFQNNDAIITAAREHTLNVFLADDPSALYLLNKMDLDAEFRHSAPVFRDKLRRAVCKGNTSLLNIVSNGFAAIKPDKLKQIDEKWFGSTINKYGHYLRYFILVVSAVAVAILFIAGLSVWNHTLRKRILQRTAALTGSEQRFRQIAENIHEVFWLIDMAKQSMLYISPAYEKIWGRSCESLYQDLRLFTDAIHPDDKARVVELKERRREPDEVEYRIVRPDGSIRWIWDRSFPIKDESGLIYRVAGIAEDITERKQAEEKLRHSEGLLAEAQRLAHFGSWDWDLQRNTVSWSDELYCIFGFEPGEMDPIHDTMSFVHPEDRDLVLKTIYGSIKNKESYSFYYRILRPNGEERIVHSRGQIVTNEAGEAIRLFGATQDLTERKRSEDELRLAYQRLSYHVENTPLAVIEWNKDLYIKRWSARAEEIFGWNATEALGKNMYGTDFPIVYEDDIEVVNKIVEHLIQGIDDSNLSLNRNYTKDGKVIYCKWYNSVLRDEHRNVITILSLVHNVTERKKTEETLKQSYEEIRRLTEHLQKIREEERTYIAREIHDELGQQLTAIKMDVVWID
ncbi:MAG: domain S-box-containing protein, partial [Chitinophagaceae bacterium]|nr:domain S-box-containing protein [Chitinophagaceae bacterium]